MISNETATELFESLRKLEAGDIVKFQAGFDPQTVHSVEVDENAVFVHFADPYANESDNQIHYADQNHAILGLTITVDPDDDQFYEGPIAKFDINGTNENISKITDVELQEQENQRTAVLNWEINKELVPRQV
ncbi:hypothetical protein [Salinibaculum rarum]|uniref:hypothetical protein n=1 Tax=Salinibaculum rarum TaxID=3058903 RepID=UPI00265F0A93|nr:hypothetical protein [Salinibaculum sp. KK48]